MCKKPNCELYSNAYSFLKPPGANNMLKIRTGDAERQIIDKQHIVDFDIKEYTIDYLVEKFSPPPPTEPLFVIPNYQREFVWDDTRMSRFIESILLGLPIPYLFSADSEDGSIEIVDGSQRLRTLAKFLNNEFSLSNLEILTNCNGMKFSEFVEARRRRFLNSSLRMIMLSEKSDEDVRYILFERINSTSALLKPMEKRIGHSQGRFMSLLFECESNLKFQKLTAFTDFARKRKEPTELILRYFAFSEALDQYTGQLDKFLTDFIKTKNLVAFKKNAYLAKFENMLSFAEKILPHGFMKSAQHKAVPRTRFEALSVGITLALEENPSLQPKPTNWLNSKAFERHVTGTSLNTVSKINDRIQYVKNQLLQKQ